MALARAESRQARRVLAPLRSGAERARRSARRPVPLQAPAL